MEFEKLTGKSTRKSRTSNHARLSFKKNGATILAFRNSGIQKLLELKLNYKPGDLVNIYAAKGESVIAFKKDSNGGNIKLSKYGREDSKRFQIYNKEFHEKSLKPGEYMIKEPLKSQAEYDFILYNTD